MKQTEIADALRGIAEQIENDAEDDEEGFESPWDWPTDHKVITKNSVGSDFGIGVAKDGHILIEHDGHVKTVDHDHLREALAEQDLD